MNRIPKSLDSAMDRQGPSGSDPAAGISIRMGPMKETTNGVNGATNGKRKSRSSLPNGKSYKETSGSEDSESDKPLVRHSRPLSYPDHHVADLATEQAKEDSQTTCIIGFLR